MATAQGSGRPVPEFIQKKGALPGFEGLEEHWFMTSQGSNLHFYTNRLGVGPPDGPIMLLAHGFPQTSYTWRYMIPTLQQKYRLFVPDQPGIAYSGDVFQQDKLTIGAIYIEGLISKYGKGSDVILGGHDRGARVVQRLAVSRDQFPDIEIVASFMLDIVPIVEQYKSLAHPMTSMNYFHWGFLPLAPIAIPMIMAFGGDRWIKTLFAQMSGQRPAGAPESGTVEDDGVEVSAAWYSQQSVNEASTRDYYTAATIDYERMVKDQADRKQIDVPTLVCHSTGLARMNDVQKIWPQYMMEGTKLEIECPGEGYGHFMPEECPEWINKKILAFLDLVGL